MSIMCLMHIKNRQSFDLTIIIGSFIFLLHAVDTHNKSATLPQYWKEILKAIKVFSEEEMKRKIFAIYFDCQPIS